MKAEIIAVGTELLIGQIVNTNAQYLSQQCANLGINVYFQTVVGDNHERIVEALTIAKERADVIICCGGLGPTQDDLTRDAIASFIGRSLVSEPTALERIADFFKKRGSMMSASNAKQALMVEGGDPLANDTGMAVGTAISHEGTHYLILPGPPKELKPMFERYATPWLRTLLGETQPLFSRMLKFAGIGESALEHELIDLIEAQQDPTIAPYAKEGEVTVRLMTRAESSEAADEKFAPLQREITERIGRFLYADHDITLEQHIVAYMSEHRLTLAVAESCTGGLFGERITSVPGSSRMFAGGVIGYSNEMKHAWLDVPLTLLDGPDAPGAVSSEVAERMAESLRIKTDTDFAVAITGVAGPAHSERKPVGLVYIAIAGRDTATFTEELHLFGNREAIRQKAVKQALYRLWQRIEPR